MGRKDSATSSEHEDDINSQQQVQIQEQVINKIKKLPTLAQKVQAIALNGYLIQKRDLDKKLQDENSALEWEHRQTYKTQVDEIQKIIEGTYDFTEQDYQDIGDLLTQEQLTVKSNYLTKEPIPEYWLKVLQASDVIGHTITQKDQPILRHLTKIEAFRNKQGTILTSIFYFSENQWFTNQSIKKQFQIEGEDIKKSYGDNIQWKEGKNVTIKIIKKKNKKKKQVKTKTVREQSFFNFFREIDLGDQDQDDQQQVNDQDQKDVQDLQQQYEISNHLYEQLVPKSLQFFLGVVGGGFDMGDLQNIEEQDEEQQQAPKKKKKNKRKSSHDQEN